MRRWLRPKAAGSFIKSLGTDDAEFARLYAVQPLLDQGEERAQVSHAVRSCSDQKDSEGQARHILLVLESPVHRQQDVEMSRDSAEQFAVLDAFPTLPSDRRCIHPGELGGQVGWQVFVKKNAHLSGPSSLQIPALQSLARG